MVEGGLLARFEEYLVSIGMAPATIANYVADIRHFCSWCEDLRATTSSLHPLLRSLLDAKADHVRHYCQALRRQGRSISTINRRLQAIRKFYDIVHPPSHNPGRDIERLNERSAASPRILTADQVNKLLCAVGDGADGLSRRNRAILLLLLDTGIKVRELIDLRVNDVDVGVGRAYVRVGEGPRAGERCLAFGPESYAALRACLRVLAPALGVMHLFVSRQALPLSVRTIQGQVSRYARAAGLEGVSAHTLRCTFAHDILEENDPSEVARMLGLRDIASIRRYLWEVCFGQQRFQGNSYQFGFPRANPLVVVR